jgi:type I restriction enzyme R subunit
MLNQRITSDSFGLLKLELKRMTPEAKVRKNIDKILIESGYVLQDMAEFNPSASLGVAVREFPTQSGHVDYLLFVEGKPVGVVEAKAEDSGNEQ